MYTKQHLITSDDLYMYIVRVKGSMADTNMQGYRLAGDEIAITTVVG